MQSENIQITFGGAEIPEVYDDLVALEIELDDELTGMFRMKLALLLDSDGAWNYLDDDRFTLWQKVVITAGLEDDSPQLISGYITHLRPDFGDGLEQCVLEIWGMDAGALMDRVDRLRDFTNKRDSDIATLLFKENHLTPRVTDTEIVHDEKVSTIIQRETDMQLLRRLALRNGFECWVDGDVGYFGPPGLAGDPQPVLAVQFGDETTVSRLSLEVNGFATTDVAMHQIDHLSGELLEATADAASEDEMGSSLSNEFLPAGVPPARVVVAQTVTTGAPEMTALAQGLYDDGSWFVTGEGDVIANDYATVLKPRATVTIKGIGDTYSGVYYVTHVTHCFTPDGYQQHFKVKRNALRTTGDEDFGGDGGGLLGALAGAL